MQNTISKLVPGLEIAKQKKQVLKNKIIATGKSPQLLIIQVGEDPASTLYVNMKAKYSEQLGIRAQKIIFPFHADTKEIVEKIEIGNKNPDIDGIMVQAPIQGRELTESLVIFNAISPEKDVDGLSSTTLGRLWQLKSIDELNEKNTFLSATPMAVMDCLLWICGSINDEDLSYKRFFGLKEILNGEKVLIVNRSNIVGKPLAALMLMLDTTVTIAHSKTKNLKEMVKNYDIILTGTGQDGIFTYNDFRNDQIVIDMGINNNNPDSIVKGDINIDGIETIHPDALPYMSCVPGGVGPLTVYNLLCNTFLSYIKNNEKS